MLHTFTKTADSYGLITEQKKGAYKYFVDLGDRMEVVGVRTAFIDEATNLHFHSAHDC